LQNYSNRFFICTTEGIYFIEVVKNLRGILTFKLQRSNDGFVPTSTFPKNYKMILAAVEIRPNKVMVAVDGMETLYVINGDARMPI
jgi:hypothetical protein